MNRPSQTPAKLILSGEHAVLYGAPALVSAITHYADTHIHPNDRGVFHFNCPALGIDNRYTLEALSQQQQQLTARHDAFIAGQLSARAILPHPAALCAYTLSLALTALAIEPTSGLAIQINTDIPVGAGMGSSAAVIISLLRAICHHYQCTTDDQTLLSLAQQAEHLPHGHSSGLDIQACYFGGLSRYQHGKRHPLANTALPFYRIDTGQPDCSTSECVQYVKAQSLPSSIWHDIGQTTVALTDALLQGDPSTIGQAIDDNHQLLCRIGVVPPATQAFIAELNQHGIAAKVCGAGAVRGNNAGTLICQQHPAAIELCREHHYHISPLTMAPRHD